MTDVGKKRGLRAIELRQRVRTALRLFIRLSIGESGGDLPGDQINESQIGIVHAAKRIDAGDQKAGRRLASLLRNGRDNGFARRLVPGAYWQCGKPMLEVA